PSSHPLSPHDALPISGPHVPPWMRRGLRWLPSDGVAGRALAWTAYRSAERLARRFIAGSNVEEALRAVAAMRRRQLAFTVDLLRSEEHTSELQSRVDL